MKGLVRHRHSKTILIGAGIITALALLLAYCGNGGSAYNSTTPASTYSYNIAGTVTSNSTGLAGVTMTLSGAGSATTTSNAGGNYVFNGLVNGSYTITPSLSGFTFTPVSSAHAVNGANITGVNFTATANTNPTFSISGTVTSSGTGLAGVTMTLSGADSATTTTDANGNYVFSGLVSGSYTVTPSKTDFTFVPVDSTQAVNSADITGVVFTATSVLTVQSVACPGSGTTDVSIQNFAFNPTTVTVSANSIVRWTNNDATTHTVTSTTVPTNGAFDSSGVSPGSSVCFQFTATGTYNYHCSIHTSMLGTVTVQ
jgi:plastocyanin